MKDKLHKIIRKLRYNMPVVHMVNKLDKDIIGMVSKYTIDYDKFIIDDINIICNDIQDSVIQNKKVYKI